MKKKAFSNLNVLEYQGNIRVYFGMVFDRYMSDLLEGKGEMQWKHY